MGCLRAFLSAVCRSSYFLPSPTPLKWEFDLFIDKFSKLCKN